MKKVLAFFGIAAVAILIIYTTVHWKSNQAATTSNNRSFPLAGGGTIQLTSEEAALTVPAGDKKVVLTGLGMACSSCHDAVAATIKKTRGVESFFVNTASDRAAIVYDPKAVSIDQIKSNLSNTGYKADDVKEIQ